MSKTLGLSLVLIFLILLDWFFPLLVSMYGAGFLPWGHRGQTRNLYQKYRLFRLPRSVFLFVGWFSLVVQQVFHTGQEMPLTIMVFSITAWGIAAFRDTVNASR